MRDVMQEHADPNTPASSAGEGWEWAIVEVFGHRRHAGKTREEERFGAKMLRIDIPVEGDPAKGWTSIFYGGSSIFSYAPSDEATVMQINRPYERPSLARLPLQSSRSEESSFDDEPF